MVLKEPCKGETFLYVATFWFIVVVMGTGEWSRGLIKASDTLLVTKALNMSKAAL